MGRSVLSWYLMRGILKWIGIVGLSMTTLIILLEMAELLRKVASKPEIGFSILMPILLLKIPGVVQQVFPFIILFASILTLWTFNRHQEMTVMKASGLSIWQLLFPLIGCVMVLGAGDLMLVNPLASQMTLRAEHLEQHHFKRNYESFAISDSGLWIREKQGAIYQVFQISHLDPLSHRCQKITLLQFDEHDRFLRRIDAQEGILKDKVLRLQEVWQQNPESMPHYRKSLTLPTNLSFTTLQNAGANPQALSFWELPKTSEMLEHSGLSGRKYQVYWHSLLARWAWLGIMVILAAGCAVRPVRQGKSRLMMSAGALCAFLLYVFRDVTYSLGNAGVLPILLSAWAPALLSILLGVTTLLYFEEK